MYFPVCKDVTQLMSEKTGSRLITVRSAAKFGWIGENWKKSWREAKKIPIMAIRMQSHIKRKRRPCSARFLSCLEAKNNSG